MTFEDYEAVLTHDERKVINREVVAEMFPDLPEKLESDARGE